MKKTILSISVVILALTSCGKSAEQLKQEQEKRTNDSMAVVMREVAKHDSILDIRLNIMADSISNSIQEALGK